MKKYFLALIPALLFAQSIQAAQPPLSFKPIPEQSSIKFEATQAGSPVRGEFKSFTSEISFSPDALEQSKVKTIIDMGSYTSDDADAKSSLKDDSWFNVAKFPKAVFETTSFKAMGDKKYEADGQLTIKGHAMPVKLIFTLNEFSTAGASITGETTLKRTGFDIGDKNTDSIKDDVKVTIVIKAVKL